MCKHSLTSYSLLAVGASRLGAPFAILGRQGLAPRAEVKLLDSALAGGRLGDVVKPSGEVRRLGPDLEPHGARCAERDGTSEWLSILEITHDDVPVVRTLQLAPQREIGNGKAVADNERAQRKEVVDAVANRLSTVQD